MNTLTIDEVYHQVRLLSPADRRKLFDRLLEDITPEPPNTFHNAAELEKMLLEGLNSGPATLMTETDWDDIRQEVRARAARRNETVIHNA